MVNSFQKPILFIIFNRPDTTQKVFDAIRLVRPRQLFVAADGPRLGNIDDKYLCESARKIIQQIDWDCEIKTLFREENLGCGKAVSSAITWFFSNVEEGIILEDDCLPAESFFYFCEIMLNKYKDNAQVGMISGTNYLFGYNNSEYSYFFSKYSYIWGWATWKRSWILYNLNHKYFPDKQFLLNYFNDDLAANYYFNEFSYFETNKIDTWDIQWSAIMIFNKLYSVVPLDNQISNIGFRGAHQDDKSYLSLNMPTKNIDLYSLKNPKKIERDNNLDYISIRNIVFKVSKKSFLKNLLVVIFKKKYRDVIKNILTLNFFKMIFFNHSNHGDNNKI